MNVTSESLHLRAQPQAGGSDPVITALRKLPDADELVAQWQSTPVPIDPMNDPLEVVEGDKQARLANRVDLLRTAIRQADDCLLKYNDALDVLLSERSERESDRDKALRKTDSLLKQLGFSRERGMCPWNNTDKIASGSVAERQYEFCLQRSPLVLECDEALRQVDGRIGHQKTARDLLRDARQVLFEALESNVGAITT